MTLSSLPAIYQSQLTFPVHIYLAMAENHAARFPGIRDVRKIMTILYPSSARNHRS